MEKALFLQSFFLSCGSISNVEEHHSWWGATPMRPSSMICEIELVKNETWEMSTLDWSNSGADGAIVSPTDVGNLIFSESREQARNAFFIVSEAVGQNGWVYPCALTVVKAVLAALPNCSGAARYECLQLIALIAASESAPNAQNIAEDCILEIRNSFWYFVYGLQFDNAELVGAYADVLGCLGLKFGDLKCTVTKYLNLALTRNFPEYDFVMVKNTIAELSK
jgi:hypothetical protein